jgi:hypothetical protein
MEVGKRDADYFRCMYDLNIENYILYFLNKPVFHLRSVIAMVTFIVCFAIHTAALFSSRVLALDADLRIYAFSSFSYIQLISSIRASESGLEADRRDIRRRALNKTRSILVSM